MLGEKISQLALMFGADDIDGTIIEEKITHSAGGTDRRAADRRTACEPDTEGRQNSCRAGFLL